MTRCRSPTDARGSIGIVLTTAASSHVLGVTEISAAQQAAEARPYNSL